MDNEKKINVNNLLIDKSDAKVNYNDELHTYWVKESKATCISVTTLIHQFTTFDEAFWSSYKTLEKLMGESFKDIKSLLLKTKKFNLEDLTKFNISIEDFEKEKIKLLTEWTEKRETSCIRGTNIHREHELEHLSGQTQELQSLGFSSNTNFNTITSNLIEPGKGIYPELLLSYLDPDGTIKLAGQADLVIVDNFDVYILDYKGLALDTPILTMTGFKLLQDLTKEDIIFDKDGNKTNILNISEVHNNPCYKITFDNGEEIIADHEHRWLVSYSTYGNRLKNIVLTTEEVKDALEIYHGDSFTSLKILNTKPLNTEQIDLPIDPYILGMWLGDEESITGSITNNNKDFWKEVQKRGYKYSENISVDKKLETRIIFDLRTELRNLNLLNNKHIPSIYLLASYEQRLDLLKGFMDANGDYNNKKQKFVLTTTKEEQANYIISLLATLGIKSSKIYTKEYYKNKEFNKWNIYFSISENPFLLQNTEEIKLLKIEDNSFRIIRSVELVKTVPTKCLEVDSDSHTFLVGYALLPTHNTNKKIDMKSFYDAKSKSSTMLKYPLGHIQDSNFWHYTLQLSSYAWMIQQIDPRFNIKLLQLIHYDHEGNKTLYECEYLKKDIEKMLAYYKKQIDYEEFKRLRKKIIF